MARCAIINLHLCQQGYDAQVDCDLELANDYRFRVEVQRLLIVYDSFLDWLALLAEVLKLNFCLNFFTE